MNKANLITFTVVLTAFFFSTHSMAGSCDRGKTLVNPIPISAVEINGVDIGNSTVVDATFEIRNDGALALRGVTTGGQVNPSNRFNPATSQVELDCVVFNENTYRAILTLSQEDEDTLLRINSLVRLFDATLTPNWTVAYNNSNGNNFPNDPLVLNADETTTLSTFPGSYQISADQQILLDYGLSSLTGLVDIGQITGNFSHFGESGNFIATPDQSERTQIKSLNGDRFQVVADWTDGTNSGRGEAISVTDDSAAFYFFDSSNVEILVRVLDGCTFNDHFWVFAGASTNVEYTLTVTDTNNGTERTFNAPLGTAINDTSAFSTCP